jgi:hypothetical protein
MLYPESRLQFIKLVSFFFVRCLHALLYLPVGCCLFVAPAASELLCAFAGDDLCDAGMFHLTSNLTAWIASLEQNTHHPVYTTLLVEKLHGC